MPFLHKLSTAILIANLLFAGCKSTSDSNIILLDAPAYHDKLEATTDARLIDVRTPEEFRQGHLPGSININWEGDDFKEEVKIFDKKQPIFLYCESGSRSSAAANFLSGEGFKEVYNLEGGFQEWQTIYPTLVEK